MSKFKIVYDCDGDYTCEKHNEENCTEGCPPPVEFYSTHGEGGDGYFLVPVGKLWTVNEIRDYHDRLNQAYR